MRRRNMQYVHGAVSSVSMRRNKFDLSHGVKTSLSVGSLVPIDVQEVLPGDTFIQHSTFVSRLSSAFLRPVMDNVFLDTYSFFVPLRLLYDEAENVFGRAEPNEYIEKDLASFPTLPRVTVAPGSIADYMGLPVGGELPAGISVLPFRAFALIYNEWFRNESVQQSVFVQKGETAVSEVFNGNAWSQNNYTGMPPKITKKKDFFTACLPAPQKGEEVALPLGGSAALTFPAAHDGVLDVADNVNANNSPMIVYAPSGSSGNIYPLYGVPNGSVGGNARFGSAAQSPSVMGDNVYLRLGVDVNGAVADLSEATAANVNDLRFAFQYQKMLEKDARYGDRYREYILGHYGVTNADARMQIPEFLGGRRIPLNMQTVAQTSAQTQTEGRFDTPLGTLGGMSHSVGKSRYIKSFTEHGYVITVASIRQLHTYQQGIGKMWFRKDRNDFYDPLFANLGEQPVYSAQLYAFNETQPLGEGNVFGYNEYGAEYRYQPSYITGQMRTGVDNSLDVYHFGDYYENAPTLSPTFINETADYFDRTVAVPSESQDNFILDIWFDTKAVRVMPLYSTPGLIDHH